MSTLEHNVDMAIISETLWGHAEHDAFMSLCLTVDMYLTIVPRRWNRVACRPLRSAIPRLLIFIWGFTVKVAAV